jgi:hypothetical protein
MHASAHATPPPKMHAKGGAVEPKTTPSSPFVTIMLGCIGQLVRFVVIDFPLALLFLLWASSVLLLHFHDEYFDKQLQLMTFIGAGRDYTDTTYYHRECTDEDITTTDVNDLIIQPTWTTKQCTDHMLLHGASLYPNLLTTETASTLREFIDEQNKIQEGWFVIHNEHRYSWGIDINMHPALHTFWKELAANRQLVRALESIVGPDPAVIEFTAITSSYGAIDQFDHSDVVSPGSAAKFGRSFVPSYSLFIPLQNVTYDMGATHVCPGTHLCSAGGPTFCPKNHNNIAMSGGKGRDDPHRNDNVWEVGAGALVNQQTTHKGMGYTYRDPVTGVPGPDRVVIIATFAPRPRFSSAVESRMIGQGGSYSILWSQNGHTFSDFVHADKRMTEPQKTLRSLGVLKGNGWNWLSVSSMRISNEDNGFDHGPLRDFVDDGGFWFLPSSWQQLDYKSFAKSNDLIPWHAFILGTVLKISEELARLNWIVLGVYFSMLVIFDVLYTLYVRSRRHSGRPGKGNWSFLMSGIIHIALTHGAIVALVWFAMQNVKSTNWARNIQNGRSFQLSYPNSSNPEQLQKSTIPTRLDILIDTHTHYASASYARVIDENHPGNRYWKEITRNYGPVYSKLPPTLQHTLCQSVIDSTRSDRRFLRQDVERYWGSIDDKKELILFCHREMLAESNPHMQIILKTMDALKVETQYGQLRDTALHRTTFPRLFGRLEKLILPCTPQKGTTNQMASQTSSNFSVPKSFLNALPNISGSVLHRREYLLPPILSPTEPFHGAWLQEGDDVEVKYQCKFNGS